MAAKFYCATCNKDLFRLDDEYTTADGAIFCPTTKEIHYRALKKESV